MKVKLTVRVEGEQKVGSYLWKYMNHAPDFMAAYRLQGSQIVMDEMKIQAPKKTHELADSVIRARTEYGFKVYPTAPHTVFVVKGTKPHEIRPRFAKVLRFFPSALMLAGGGSRTGSRLGGPTTLSGMQAGALKPIFAMVVHHPGTKPNPFIRRTAEIVRPKLKLLAREIWKRLYP